MQYKDTHTSISIAKNEAVGYNQSAMESCIRNCLESFKACSQLIPHCLSMGGKHAAPEHILLLSSCAESALTATRFMMSGSEFHTETCMNCAMVCQHCAEECERMEGADDRMLMCADICRKAAASCEQMADQFNEH